MGVELLTLDKGVLNRRYLISLHTWSLANLSCLHGLQMRASRKHG